MGLRETNRSRRMADATGAAAELFLEYGIDGTTYQDVADRAGLGVATLYRYFPAKGDLVVEAAILIWERAWRIEWDLRGPTAMDKVRDYLERFVRFYREHPAFLAFIEDFDNFIARQDVRPEGMDRYEKTLELSWPIMEGLIRDGMAEGSLRGDLDPRRTFHVISQAFMALAQKQLLRGHIITSDDEADPEDMLRTLGDMVLAWIRPPVEEKDNR